MHEAILKTGRPMVYSLCQYGFDAVWDWAPEVGANLWRTTGDIDATFDRMAVIGFNQDGLEKFAAPGHWNDPDMLEVGNGKLTLDENRFHMTLWAMLASPLLAGNDLTRMTPEVASVLMNKQVIAIDQDPAGHQGRRIYQEGPIQFWARTLADGSTALAIFNTGVDASSAPQYSVAVEAARLCPPAARDGRMGRQAGWRAGRFLQANASAPLDYPAEADEVIMAMGELACVASAGFASQFAVEFHSPGEPRQSIHCHRQELLPCRKRLNCHELHPTLLETIKEADRCSQPQAPRKSG